MLLKTFKYRIYITILSILVYWQMVYFFPRAHFLAPSQPSIEFRTKQHNLLLLSKEQHFKFHLGG